MSVHKINNEIGSFDSMNHVKYWLQQTHHQRHAYAVCCFYIDNVNSSVAFLVTTGMILTSTRDLISKLETQLHKYTAFVTEALRPCF